MWFRGPHSSLPSLRQWHRKLSILWGFMGFYGIYVFSSSFSEVLGSTINLTKQLFCIFEKNAYKKVTVKVELNNKVKVEGRDVTVDMSESGGGITEKQFNGNLIYLNHALEIGLEMTLTKKWCLKTNKSPKNIFITLVREVELRFLRSLADHLWRALPGTRLQVHFHFQVLLGTLLFALAGSYIRYFITGTLPFQVLSGKLLQVHLLPGLFRYPVSGTFPLAGLLRYPVTWLFPLAGPVM